MEIIELKKKIVEILKRKIFELKAVSVPEDVAEAYNTYNDRDSQYSVDFETIFDLFNRYDADRYSDSDRISIALLFSFADGSLGIELNENQKQVLDEFCDAFVNLYNSFSDTEEEKLAKKKLVEKYMYFVDAFRLGNDSYISRISDLGEIWEVCELEPSEIFEMFSYVSFRNIRYVDNLRIQAIEQCDEESVKALFEKYGYEWNKINKMCQVLILRTRYYDDIENILKILSTHEKFKTVYFDNLNLFTEIILRSNSSIIEEFGDLLNRCKLTYQSFRGGFFDEVTEENQNVSISNSEGNSQSDRPYHEYRSSYNTLIQNERDLREICLECGLLFDDIISRNPGLLLTSKGKLKEACKNIKGIFKLLGIESEYKNFIGAEPQILCSRNCAVMLKNYRNLVNFYRYPLRRHIRSADAICKIFKREPSALLDTIDEYIEISDGACDWMRANIISLSAPDPNYFRLIRQQETIEDGLAFNDRNQLIGSSRARDLIVNPEKEYESDKWLESNEIHKARYYEKACHILNPRAMDDAFYFLEDNFKKSDLLYVIAGVRISRNKVIRICNAVYSNNPSADKKEILLYSILYNTKLDEEQIKAIKEAIKPYEDNVSIQRRLR